MKTSRAKTTAHYIIEDRTGFLWFGANDGLRRYDGYRFRDFRSDPSNAKAMSGVAVKALLADGSVIGGI